jgi:hypothetical protein
VESFFYCIIRTSDRALYGAIESVIKYYPALSERKVVMSHISANDLKTKGVAAIEAMLEGATEAIVSVRGKDRFVVMDIAHYHYLRECELDAALAETRADLADGRFVKESVGDHVARLDQVV